jgi:hypothetical protein
MEFNMDGYVDVAERIRQLREKHPEAVLRPYDPANPFKVMEIGGREFIIYTAACYRTPDDPMPAIAVAAEPAVGKTNYTRDSEVMNAETSAWGRCIVAALAADTQKIASLDEVRNRKAEEAAPSVRNHPATHKPQPVDDQRAIDMITEQMGGMLVDSKPANVRSITGGGITDKQKGLLSKLAKEKCDGDLKPIVKQMFNKDNPNTLTKEEGSALIKALMEMK